MKALVIALLTAGLASQAFAGESAVQPIHASAPAMSSAGRTSTTHSKAPSVTTPAKAGQSAIGSMTPVYVAGGIVLGAVVVGSASSSSHGNSNSTGTGGTTGTTGT